MRISDFLVQLWYAEQSVELEVENWRCVGQKSGTYAFD